MRFSRLRAPLLPTGEEESDSYRFYPLHRCWPFVAVLTLLAVALLIVAAVEPSIFSSKFTSALGEAEFTIGAFRLCYHAGELSGCQDIDSACEFSALGDRLPDVKGAVVSNCDEFNAARALLVLAVVFIAVGLLFQLCASMRAWVKGTSALAFTFTLLGALCGLVCMALYARTKAQENGLLWNDANYGYSFVLICVGWVLAFIAAFAFWPFGED